MQWSRIRSGSAIYSMFIASFLSLFFSLADWKYPVLSESCTTVLVFLWSGFFHEAAFDFHLFCRIDHEASVVMLENECYNKYGKSRKSFYYSQLASTARWISTANSEELVNRLKSSSPACEATSTKTDSFSTPTSTSAIDGGVQIQTNDEKEKECHSMESETPVRALQNVCEDAKLPPIPSFSDFVNRRKPNDNQLTNSRNQSSTSSNWRLEKRMKYK